MYDSLVYTVKDKNAVRYANNITLHSHMYVISYSKLLVNNNVALSPVCQSTHATQACHHSTPEASSYQTQASTFFVYTVYGYHIPPGAWGDEGEGSRMGE